MNLRETNALISNSHLRKRRLITKRAWDACDHREAFDSHRVHTAGCLTLTENEPSHPCLSTSTSQPQFLLGHTERMRMFVVLMTAALAPGLTAGDVQAQESSDDQSFVLVDSAVLDLDPSMKIIESTGDGGFVTAESCRWETALCVERFDANGQIDTTFGDDGTVVVVDPVFTLNGWAEFWPSTIDVAADGTVTVLADCINWYAGRDQYDMVDMCLIRISAEGDPHPSISGGVIAYALDRYQSAGGLSLNEDGSGWISGYCSSSTCVGRITASGELDATWDDGSYFPGLTKAKFGEFSMSYGIVPAGDGAWSYGRCENNPLYPNVETIREGCVIAFGGAGGVATDIGANGHIDFLPSSEVSGGKIRVSSTPAVFPVDEGGYVVVASCTSDLDSWLGLACVTRLDDSGNLMTQPNGQRVTFLPVGLHAVEVENGRVMIAGRCDGDWYDNNRPCFVTYDAVNGPLTTPTVLPLDMENSWDLTVMPTGTGEATVLGRCNETQTCVFKVRSSSSAPLSPPQQVSTPTIVAETTTTTFESDDTTTTSTPNESSTTVAATSTTDVPTTTQTAVEPLSNSAGAVTQDSSSGGGAPVGVIIILVLLAIGAAVSGITFSRRPSKSP